MKNKAIPRAIQIFSILLFIIATIFVAFILFPFAPYKYLEFVYVPDKVCPVENVRTTVEREIDTPFLGRIDEIDIKSWWEDTSNGDKLGGDALALTPPDIPTNSKLEQVDSPVLRTAPKLPGEYWMVTETTTYGVYGFVPRVQKFTTYSEHTVRVRDDCE